MEEVSLGSFGEAEPKIGLRFAPGDGASAAAKGVYIAELSKTSPLSAAIPALTKTLGVPENAVTLMHDGLTLNLEKSLAENEVTIPGARARREGEKVQLCFDTQFSIMQEVEEEARKRKEEEEAETKKKLRLEMEEQQKEKKRLEDMEREREKNNRAARANEIFDEQIAQHVGVNRQEFDRLLGDPDPDVKKPKHYLERLRPEQEQAVLSLLRASGGSGTQCWAYFVHHQELRERFERAKQGLQADAANIPKKKSTTTSSVGPELAFLGRFDPSINEFCLWHGTARLEGAGGICANGFDIAYVGSAVGTAWGHGFYFADSASMSMGYTGGGVRVTEQHCRVKIMFLCRVLCGRIRELSAAPTQQEKEELTAKCLGPGGVFGSKSEVHSIHGGRFCYVCAHNHQIYPEVVIFLS